MDSITLAPDPCRDIGQQEVLSDIAGSIELDRAAFEQALKDGKYSAAHEADLREAKCETQHVFVWCHIPDNVNVKCTLREPGPKSRLNALLGAYRCHSQLKTESAATVIPLRNHRNDKRCLPASVSGAF